MSQQKSELSTFQKTLLPGEALVVSRPSDIEYLTGFKFLIPLDQEREAYLVVGADSATLIHASFSEGVGVVGAGGDSGAGADSKAGQIVSIAGCSPHQLKSILSRQVLQNNIKKIGYDADSLFVTEFEAIKDVKKSVEAGAGGDTAGADAGSVVFEQWNRQNLIALRMKKNPDEVAKIKKACDITKQAWEVVSKELGSGKLAGKKIGGGITELEIAKILEAQMRELGAEGLAFPTIVCFGAHSALPHHQPTDTILVEDTPILVDMGAKYAGYCADMTRTIWFGQNPSSEFLHAKKVVEQAYEAVIGLEGSEKSASVERSATTLTAKKLDSAARSVITQAGFEKLFIHTTGHGLGLEIHEPPSLNWKNEQVVEPGMVITIEPGIYFPDQFGFRYENTVLITQTGDKISYEELTK